MEKLVSLLVVVFAVALFWTILLIAIYMLISKVMTRKRQRAFKGNTNRKAWTLKE